LSQRRLVGEIVLAFFILLACELIIGAPKSSQSLPKPLQHEVSVTLKLVQVYVTDRKGNPVTDLRKEDFIVYDNGRPVGITEFEKHVIPIARSDGGRVEEKIIPTPVAAARRVQLLARRFFLFFDFAYNNLGGIKKAKEAALHFIDYDVLPGDEVGLLSISMLKGLVIHEYLSTDHRKVRDAVAALDPGEVVAGRAADIEEEYWRRMAEGKPPDKEGQLGVKPLGELNADRQAAKSQALLIVRRITELAKALRNVPGQKHFIFFSTGVPGSMIYGYQSGNAQVSSAILSAGWRFRGYDFGDPVLRPANEEMYKELAASACSVFFFDTREAALTVPGASLFAYDDETFASGHRDIFYGQSATKPPVELFKDEKKAGGYTIGRLSKTTGGEYFSNINDFEKNLNKVQVLTGGEVYIFGAEDSPWRVAPDLVGRALSCLDFMLYDEAISLFEQILAEEPGRTGIRSGLAYAYHRLANLDKAFETLNSEIKLHPEDFKALILISFLQYRAGRVDEAERFALAFDAALEKVKKPNQRNSIIKDLFPNAGIPAFILGLTAADRGDAVSARSWFIKARDLDYFPLDCWAEAIDDEIRRENWDEALRLGLAEGNLAPAEKTDGTRTKIAARIVKKKAIIAPSAEIYLRLGFIYDRLGKSKESLSALQTAAAMKPFDGGVLKSLAIAHLNRGDAAAAEAFLARAVKLAPSDFESRGLLDRAKSGRLRAGATGEVSSPIPLPIDFLRADGPRLRYVFAGNPDDIAGKMNGYALRLIREGLVLDAYRLLRSFAEIYENSPTIFFNLGLLANSLERPAEALEGAMRAIELKSEYRDAYDLAANACFKIGDFATSAALYEEAVRLEPVEVEVHCREAAGRIFYFFSFSSWVAEF
jgi:VWFA-related protein